MVAVLILLLVLWTSRPSEMSACSEVMSLEQITCYIPVIFFVTGSPCFRTCSSVRVCHVSFVKFRVF